MSKRRTEEQLLEFLLTHVRRDDVCLVWAGTITKDGYPQVSHLGKTYLAQRLMLTLLGRRMPRGYCVWQNCGTKACMNPEHLVLVRRGDVIRRHAKAGRMQSGVARSLAVALGRAKNARMPITERDNVLRLRAEGWTYQQIGDKYGVQKTAVGHALRAWARALGRES